MLWSHFYGRGKKYPFCERGTFCRAAEDRSIRDGPLRPRGNPHDSTSILDLLSTHINFISLLRDLSITGTQCGPVWCLVPKCPPTRLSIITTLRSSREHLGRAERPVQPRARGAGGHGPSSKGFLQTHSHRTLKRNSMAKPAMDQSGPKSPRGPDLCLIESSTSTLSKRNYNPTFQKRGHCSRPYSSTAHVQDLNLGLC